MNGCENKGCRDKPGEDRIVQGVDDRIRPDRSKGSDSGKTGEDRIVEGVDDQIRPNPGKGCEAVQRHLNRVKIDRSAQKFVFDPI